LEAVTMRAGSIRLIVAAMAATSDAASGRPNGP